MTIAAFWTPLSTLLRFSLRHEHYSHIMLIPMITAGLLVLERRRIFANPVTDWRVGAGVLGTGAAIYWVGHLSVAAAMESDRLSIDILAMVVMWVAAFMACYGVQSLRAGLLPVLFPFVMVPIPDIALERAIFWLQAGSAEVTDVLFWLLGVPVFRSGFTFQLPSVTIEIARECSGIRSSMVLLIVSILAGHLFLRSAVSKIVLILVTIPLLIVKNGIRIVTLSLLSVYVDRAFLEGELHREGGIVFFCLALLLLLPVVWLLQRSEGSWKGGSREMSVDQIVRGDGRRAKIIDPARSDSI